ncbi:MAG: glycerol-3-phosphate 1-O-acyltransferase PlsY [Silicimonas sp.]|nr:glycerol-3-phosphate 1-O-acyltransferase PlsY [Silicimonas sp.]
MLLLLAALVAYLLGSIPFGIVVTRLFGLGDIRKIGSGNIGATNVLRTGSKSAALTTVLLDAGKGLLAVIGARALVGEDAAQVAALFSFLGHLFPVWLGFRGGKGVATLLGAIVGLSPLLGFVALLAWLFTFFVYRISSLSALMAAPFTVLVAFLVDEREMLAFLIVSGALMIWKHWPNVRRLIDGTEPTTSWSKK